MIPPKSPDSAQPVFGTGSSNSGAISGTSTIRGDWVDISACTGCSFDIGWSGGAGGPAATFGVEVSNANPAPAATVAAIGLTLNPTPTAVSGASGVSGVDVPVTGFMWARLTVTPSAGTFNLAALAFAKRWSK